MQNPYFFFDNPLIVNELMKQGIDVDKLLENAKTTQEAIDRLSAYVDTLDEAVRDEVLEQLENMIDDGTIASVLSGVKNPAQSLELSRVFRQIYISGKHNAYYNPVTANLAYYAQGACSYIENGNKYYVNICPHYMNNQDNTAEIRVYNLNGALLRYADVITGHSNSITYRDGYYYVVEATRSGNPSNYIHKIDANTLVTVATKYLSYGGSDIIGRAISCYNEQLYVTDFTNIYAYDFDTNTLTFAYQIPSTYRRWGQTHLGCQNFTIDANYYYLLYIKPNTIVKINRTTNEPTYIYNLNDISKDFYRLGELQSISIYDNGIMDLFTSIDLEPAAFAQHSVFNVFTTNIYTNVVSGYDDLQTSAKYTTLNVDNRGTEHKNPDGSADRPFYYIQEAINYACDCGLFTNYTIQIASINGFTSATVICTNKTITIAPASSMTTNVNVGGIYAWGCNLYLRDLNIANSFNSSDNYNQVVTVINGNIHASGCYLRLTPNSDSYTNVTRGIYLYDSMGVFSNNTAQGDGNIATWIKNSYVVEATSGTIPT